MDYEYNDRKQESVYSRRLKAGKRRTYFFDVRETRGSDFFLTITESRKRFNDDGYDRHKIFLYKEDFNKFIKGLTEAVDFVKTDLMPDYDFDIYSHEGEDQESAAIIRPVATKSVEVTEPTDVPAPPSAETTTDFEQELSAEVPESQKTEADTTSLTEIEAERLHEQPETVANDLENENEKEHKVDKLASEEVEKW